MQESPTPPSDQNHKTTGVSADVLDAQIPSGSSTIGNATTAVLRVTWRVIYYSAIVIFLFFTITVLSRAGVSAGVQQIFNRTKALNNARNIGMALMIYANEHNGEFPPGNTAAEVFSHLLPQDGAGLGYIDSKKAFWVKGSMYTPVKDNAGLTASNRLEPGENHWSFMQGPRSSRDGRWPLVFDGPANPDGTYSSKKSEKGGVWEGKFAIVVRSDGSASAEPLKDLRLQGDGQTNLLLPTDRWLPGAKLLMPW